MSNNKLKNESISSMIEEIEPAPYRAGPYGDRVVSALRELQERRKFDQAKLINKFYERYPLDTFKSDSERAEALGYYMAGAELQRCGEFIVYEDANCDE
ncbi:hypothetical protein ACMD7D_004192 [Citrobacter freundii]